MKNETDALNEAIIILQDKRGEELDLLMKQWDDTVESLKPINIIKSLFSGGSSSSEIKSIILGSAIGLGTGYLSKRLLGGSSHNPIKKMFGSFIQFAIAYVVLKHAKSVGGNLLNRYRKRKNDSEEKFIKPAPIN